MQLKLTEPLVAGNKYQFSMFVNLANNSGYATDQIGVVFTSEDRTKKGISKFLGHSDINNALGNFLNDTVNWNEMAGVYNAKGGEKYLIIGNFQGCDLTSRKAINPTDSLGTMNNMKRKYMEGISTAYAHIDSEFSGLAVDKLAYYFIDNISLRPITSNDSIGALSPDSACLNMPEISNNSPSLIRDGGFRF